MTIFGPLWHPGLLESAVLSTLKTWLPTYLSEVCLQDAETTGTTQRNLSLPKSWGVVSEYDRFPEAQLPAIIIAAAGMTDEPVRRGDGELRGSWSVEVSVTLTADKGKTARYNAQLYLTAISAALLQRRSLGDGMNATEWTGVQYADVPTEKRRSIVAAATAFTVTVQNMLSTNDGPTSPAPPDPLPTTWPEVQETNIETEIT